MATVFGLSGLKSKLDGWRGIRKNAKSEPAVAKTMSLVGEHTGDAHLSLLLETVVIPKLIAGVNVSGSASPMSQPSTSPIASRRPAIEPADVVEFTRLAIADEPHALAAFIDERLKSGLSVEAIYLHLLAPAARRLGEYWEQDSADFVAVTMGLWRIQELLRELAVRVPPHGNVLHGQRSALFAPMPGEQHSLGTLMVSECFQRTGWECDALIEPTQHELTERIATRPYDLVGLTVSCDCSTATLASVVKTIKSVSPNPHVRIMLGGRVLNEQPELVGMCGADATAIDAMSALNVADQLVPVRVECLQQLI